MLLTNPVKVCVWFRLFFVCLFCFEFSNSGKEPMLLFSINQLFPLCAVPVQLHDGSEYFFSPLFLENFDLQLGHQMPA